ncbi:MAG: hypothetical protein JRC90_05790 [Deltaproteobacteria bacterium]|nr:hypothetical protein [Deltaproteobacteria bacterium]
MAKKRATKPLPERYGKAVPKDTPKSLQLKAWMETEDARLFGSQKWIELFHDDFKNTENPLAAWDAFMVARKYNEPVPTWVLEYLEKVGKQLLKAENTSSDLPHCLGFMKDSGPGPWKEYHLLQIRRTALSYVYKAAIEEPEKSLFDICYDAAEAVKMRWGAVGRAKRGTRTDYEDADLSGDTILRWYHELNF